MATVARGKAAEYGQEIIKRRFRLTQSLAALKNKTILDFGCGNGAQTIKFANTNRKILAVDIDLHDLRTLAAHLNERRLNTITPIQYDGAHLPIATNSIDLVTSYEVLEHVQDENVALREIYRVLKPQGEIVISVPNKGWIFETHGAYLPLLPWNRIPFFSWLPHCIHRRFAKARIYRKREIVELLETHSFKILGAQYIMAPLDVVKNPQLKQFLRKMIFGDDTTRLTFLSTAILVHARKI